MSKVRTALVLAAGLGLAVASQATAAPSAFKITGGGQIVTPDATYATGARDTLAYTAQGNAALAKGQVQYVARGSNSGTSFHGVVTAIDGVTNDGQDGGMGEICGHERGVEANTFVLYVVDGGEGKDAMDTATLTLDGDCDGEFDGEGQGENGEDAPQAEVARGNAQVHKTK